MKPKHILSHSFSYYQLHQNHIFPMLNIVEIVIKTTQAVRKLWHFEK